MYLVLTVSNAADTTIPHVAPRFITSDARKALQQAWATLQDRFAAFVELIMIFEITEGEPHDDLLRFRNVRDESDERDSLLVFTAHPSDGQWIEKSSPDFARALNAKA